MHVKAPSYINPDQLLLSRACNKLRGSKWQILRPQHQMHSSLSFFSTWHSWLQRSAMMLTCEISHSCTCLLQNPDNSRWVAWNTKSKVFCALKTMETFHKWFPFPNCAWKEKAAVEPAASSRNSGRLWNVGGRQVSSYSSPSCKSLLVLQRNRRIWSPIPLVSFSHWIQLPEVRKSEVILGRHTTNGLW